MRMDYMYWEAGNQSHTNEMHSIIEELKEAGYIH